MVYYSQEMREYLKKGAGIMEIKVIMVDLEQNRFISLEEYYKRKNEFIAEHQMDLDKLNERVEAIINDHWKNDHWKNFTPSVLLELPNSLDQMRQELNQIKEEIVNRDIMRLEKEFMKKFKYVQLQVKDGQLTIYREE